MSRATVELDFFGMKKDNSDKYPAQKLVEPRRTVRDIQSAISKINPQLLKSVIVSGGATGSFDTKFPENDGFRQNCRLSAPGSPFSVPSTPVGNQSFFPTLPFLSPSSRSSSENPSDKAPLTIFYNGTVTVFDVPRDKAEIIMKLAEKRNSKTAESMDPKPPGCSGEEHELLKKLDGEMPIARRKSLQRFFEKRKERLTSLSPYACPSESVNDKEMRA